MKIRYKIKEIRTDRNLSLEQLAKMSGLNKSTIQEIETHQTKPKFDSILKLAKALNVEVTDLYEEIEEEK